jgi:hypothetical protein
MYIQVDLETSPVQYTIIFSCAECTVSDSDEYAQYGRLRWMNPQHLGPHCRLPSPGQLQHTTRASHLIVHFDIAITTAPARPGIEAPQYTTASAYPQLLQSDIRQTSPRNILPSGPMLRPLAQVCRQCHCSSGAKALKNWSVIQ